MSIYIYVRNMIIKTISGKFIFWLFVVDDKYVNLDFKEGLKKHVMQYKNYKFELGFEVSIIQGLFE